MEVKKTTKLKKRNNDLLLVYVFAVLCLGALHLVVKPIFEEKNALDQQVAAKEEDFNKKNELLQSIEDINRSNKISAEDAKKLSDFVAKRNSYEDLYGYLESLARENNLRLTDYKLADSAQAIAPAPVSGAPTVSEGTEVQIGADEKSRLQKQRLSFNLQGDYNNTSAFLKKVENGIPFLQLVSVSVGGKEKTDSQQGTGSSPINIFAVNMDFLHY